MLSFKENLSGFFPWDLPVVKISPEWVTGREQGKCSGRVDTFSLWIGMSQNVNRMPRNRLPRVMKHYCLTGRRNHGRPLKRLLDTWDRNGSTSGPTPWKIYDDDKPMMTRRNNLNFWVCIGQTGWSEVYLKDNFFTNTKEINVTIME